MSSNGRKRATVRKVDAAKVNGNGRSKVDWLAAERDYVNGVEADGQFMFPTLNDIARLYGVTKRTVAQRSTDMGWERKRAEAALVLHQRINEHTRDRVTTLHIEALDALGLFVRMPRAKLRDPVTGRVTDDSLADADVDEARALHSMLVGSIKELRLERGEPTEIHAARMDGHVEVERTTFAPDLVAAVEAALIASCSDPNAVGSIATVAQVVSGEVASE